MIADKKSIWLPVLISLFVSLGVFIALWWLKDSQVKEYVLTVTLLTSLAIFILFILYFLVARIFLVFKRPIWLSGIPSALIIYLGAIIISLSYFKDVVDKMDWDVNMIGLGIVVVVIGMSLLPRYRPPQPEETLKELKAHSDDLGDKLAAFGEAQSNLKNLMGLVSQEAEIFLKSLAKLMEESRKKR